MSTPPPENRLLSSLPPADFARLTARMTDVTFRHKDVLYRAGGTIDHVYFPRSGVLSYLLTMLDGATAEVATIGPEGMAGALLFLGESRSPEEVLCQVAPCECRRMRAADFTAEVDRGGPFRDAARWFARADRTVSARLTPAGSTPGTAGTTGRAPRRCDDRLSRCVRHASRDSPARVVT